MMAVVKTGVGKMEHKEIDVPSPKGNEVLVKMEHLLNIKLEMQILKSS